MKRKMLFTSRYCLLMGLLLVFVGCSGGKAPEAYGPIPTEHQLNWQQLETYMFIHFGPNTFTDVEWGDGQEDPKVFNPTQLDCNQWAEIAKQAGLKGIIITAKHHDGFCLWPSKFSNHTVRESSWKEGKGDLLKELSEACAKYELKFGVYLSPWDQNHPSYGTPEYNTVFANTLEEVLTNYGPVFEQWFDGACGESANGKKQEYDWDLFHNVVYKNQPQAIIFSDVGPGARWMGNESGIGGETNWSTLNVKGFAPGAAAPALDVLNQGNRNGEAWIPAEVDVSIRPGWFYSPRTDDKVKTLEQLVDIYYTSVGRNSNLLLNIPIDRRGLVHPNDSARLLEFGRFINQTFSTNLIEGAKVEASNNRGSSYKPSNLIDGNFDTYWAPKDHATFATLEITLPEMRTFNRIQLQEYIPLGQRVEEFSIECWSKDENDWITLKTGTTIGYKRILRFPTTTANRIRVNIEKSLACPVLNEIGLFFEETLIESPRIIRNQKGEVTLSSKYSNAEIYYTIDGSNPTSLLNKYEDAFVLHTPTEVQAVVVANNMMSEISKEVFDVSAIKWSINKTITQGNKAIDGNNDTFITAPIKTPFICQLGETLSVKGFTYTPLNDVEAPSIYKYKVLTSLDGEDWKEQEIATFDNVKNNPIKQVVQWDTKVEAKFIKIDVIETTTGTEEYTLAEFGVLTQ